MLDAYLAKNIEGKNEFIRTETFIELKKLAAQYPEINSEVNQLLNEEKKGNAELVNARIRRIYREIDKKKTENIYK